MIISHEHKFIFLHIPRTGGRSVYEALIPYGAKLVNHSCKYYWQVPHEMVVPREYSGYCVFTCVRNPFRRAISAYLHHQQHPENFYHKWAKAVSFEDFLRFGFWNLEASQMNLLSGCGSSVETIKTENGIKYRIQNLLGLEIKLKKLNCAVYEKPWQHYYTDKAKSIVQDLCHRDFEMLAYPKEIEPNEKSGQ